MSENILNLVSKQRVSRVYLVVFLVLIVFSAGVISTAPRNVDAVTESDNPVEILLLLNHGYGGNVPSDNDS